MKKFIDKLISRLEEQRGKYWSDNSDYGNGNYNGICESIEIVNQFAKDYSVNPRQMSAEDWIPCDKELPPQPKDNLLFENKPLELYLVTIKNQDYPFRAFWNGKFFTDGWGKVDATAWMPLPASYKVEDEED